MVNPIAAETDQAPASTSPGTEGYDSLISYRPFLEELEELNQEFLLRNYATVWSGCLELIVKLIRLPSPTGSPTNGTLLKGQTRLPLIEAWKSQHSPSSHESTESIPEHFFVSFQLWSNAWSLLIALIGKWHEQSQGFNNGRSELSSQEKAKEAFKTPDSGFSINDMEAIEDKVYAMERNLESIWSCLSQFYYPEPHTIPSEMLIAVKQEKFQVSEEIVTTWRKAIPESWTKVLKSNAIHVNWEDESEESWRDKFCLHYDSIMTLYISHVLVGQERWKDAPVILKEDGLLPEERKALISELLEQAWQEHEAALHQKKPLPVHSASALAAVQATPRTISSSGSQISLASGSGTLMSRESSSASQEKGFLAKYLQHIKDNLNRTSSLAALGGTVLFAAALVWYAQRRRLKVSSTGIFTGGWGTYWLYRIFQSARPALPPTSGGPDSI